MSTRNNDMVSLLNRQEEDKKDLAAGAYEAWQAVKENENRLLTPFDGQQERAPKEINDAVIKGRENYFKEWGSDGRLAAVMSERHERERGKRAAMDTKKQEILNQFKQNRQRSKNDDRER